MNMMLSKQLEDVQNRPDSRQIAIDQVGVNALRYPIRFQHKQNQLKEVVAEVSMSVGLAHHLKGTHMSRFIELLEEPDLIISLEYMPKFMSDLLKYLEAKQALVRFQFPLFIAKKAPVTGVKSMMDYQVTIVATQSDAFSQSLVLEIPVTSLCPCSKKISDYGAHNQRSLITVEVQLDDVIEIDSLIQQIESQASSQLYGLLKRQDEKFVTEHAYENPKFVEDLVRDVAAELDVSTQIKGFKVLCENFESIHNHSAFAMIDRLKTI